MKKLVYTITCMLVLLFSMSVFAVDSDLNSSPAETYSQTRSSSITVGDLDKIKISIHNGDAKIIAVDGKTVEYNVRKRLRNVTKEEADTILSAVQVVYFAGARGLVIKSTINGTADFVKRVNRYLTRGYLTTDITVKVPREMSLYYSSLKGSINVTGMKNRLKLSAMNGDVELADVKSAKIYAIKGDLRVQDMAGDLKADIFTGVVHLNGVEGNVLVTNKVGDIKIKNIVGNVKATSTTGNIRLSNIQGGIKISSIKGKVKIDSSLGPVDAQSKKGSVELRNARFHQEDGVNLISVEGDVKAQIPSTMAGELKAQTNTGILKNDFEVKTSSGRVIKWRKRRNSIIGMLNFGKEGKNKVFLKTVNGDIILRKKNVR